MVLDVCLITKKFHSSNLSGYIKQNSFLGKKLFWLI